MQINYNNIIGKHILVGLTYVNSQKDITKKVQFHGNILTADQKNGITVQCNMNGNKEDFVLPPDLSAIKLAPQGTYTLKSTDEEVINPDLLAAWTIHHST